MISYVNKLGTVMVGDSSPVRIMGILNTSPESFYKKSISITKKRIVNTVNKMEEEGADFIDVGGMSTAPYLSTMVSEKTEVSRIIKAVKIIQQASNLPISVDTCRSVIAREALELGVDIINDVTGLKYDHMMPKIIEKYRPSLVLCAYSKKTITGNQLLKTKYLLRES
jgi:dihydropteroate synthase